MSMRYICLFVFILPSLVTHASLNSKECNGHGLGGFSAELREPNSCTTHGFLLPHCPSSNYKKDGQKRSVRTKTKGIGNSSSN